MMLDFSCTVANHFNQPIIRICLAIQCKRSRKLCYNCWQEMHQEHQLDCVPYSFLETILLDEENKLDLLKELILSDEKENKNNQQRTLIVERIQRYLTLTGLYRSKLFNNPYPHFREMVKLVMKSYNGIIAQEFINLTLQEFEIDSDKLMASTIRKQIKLIYGQQDMAYLIKKLAQQGTDLFQGQRFSDTKLMFDVVLRQELRPEYLEKKYLSLLLANRQDEASQFVASCKVYGLKPHHFLAMSEGIQASYLAYQLFYKNDNPLIEASNNPFELGIASSLYFSKQYDQCLDILEKILTQQPENGFAIELKVQALLNLHQEQNALQFCEEGLKKYEHCDGYFRAKCNNCLYLGVCILRCRLPQQEIANIQNKDEQHILMKGFLLMQERKNEEAAVAFDEIKPDQKVFQIAQYLKGCILIGQQKHDEGMQQLQDVSFKNKVFANWLEFSKLIAEKKYSEAQIELKQKLKFSKKSKILRIFKCELLVRQNKFDKALKCIKVVSSYYQDDQVLKFIEASMLTATKRFQEALKKITEVLEAKYITFETLELKAKLLCGSDKYQKAMECFKQCCQMFPKEPKGFFYRGVVPYIKYCCFSMILLLKDYLNATLDFEKVLELEINPQTMAALYNKGIALCQRNKFFEASEVFCTMLNYQESRIYYIYSLIKLKRYDEADVAILNSDNYQFQHQQENLQFLKCQILITKEKYQQACEIFQFMEIKQLSDYQKYQYGLTLLELKRFDEAYQIVDQVKKETFLLFFFKGYWLEQQNIKDQALEHYNMSLGLKEQPCVLWAKIQLLYEMQQIQEADALQEELSNKFPNFNFEEKRNSLTQMILQNEQNYRPELLDLIKFGIEISKLIPHLSFDRDSMLHFQFN